MTDENPTNENPTNVNENGAVNDNVTGTDDAAAQRKARLSGMRRQKGRVVAYSQADAETKARMDEMIADILANPDSFDHVVKYGSEPMKRLGKLSDEMIVLQTQFDTQINVMGGALGRLQKSMKDMDIQSLGSKVKSIIGTGFDVVKKGTKGGFKILGKAFNVFSKKKLDEEEKERLAEEQKRCEMIDDIQRTIPKMQAEMDTLIREVAKADVGITQVIKAAEAMGVTRVEIVDDIALYIGASEEVIRQYNDVIIPEAEQFVADEGTAEAQSYLDGVRQCFLDFSSRVANLEASKLSGINAGITLLEIINVLKENKKKASEIIENGQNEWKAMIALAGLVGSAFKSSQNMKKYDDFGDKVHDQTMKTLEEAHKISLESSQHGVVKSDKLIEQAQRLGAMLEESANAAVTKARVIEEMCIKMRTASDKLLDARENIQQRTLEEAAVTTFPTTGNDNGVKAKDGESVKDKIAKKKTGTTPKP